ncbi:MAG TPA: M12 family metallo-peptidase, partial [Acidobacteriota bacterium]|nr:M12 family metallo-peptidase [Acidobacteriota bacterium]
MRNQRVFIFLLGGLLLLGSSVWQTSGKRYVPSSEAATLTNLNVPVKVFVTTFPSPTNQDRPQSEDTLWQDVDVAITRAVQLQEPNWIKPLEYRSVALNEGALAGMLHRAPLEFSPEALSNRVVMTFPMPDGTSQRFAIVESPVMGPELAAAWTHIRTYAGQGIDDPTATIRFDVSPVGLRAMILSADETVFIDPAKRGGTNLYLSYFKRNYLNAEKEAFACELPSPEPGLPDLDNHRLSVTPKALPSENPIRLRTYRLVVCANAEYGNAAGGGVLANAQAAVVTTVNRVTGLYERDLAVRLNLVHAYVFVGDTTADPFTDGANSNAGTAWGENTVYINTNWGDASYDIGHFFSTGAGGRGDIAQVCVTGRKANGATGQGSPTGDAYDIDYVAHEMG